MNISIQKAKNGEETALAENCFLHSGYAPSKEAERYVQGLEIFYQPQVIVVCEPALSYVADFLRQRFPSSKIGAIRYTDFFASFNSKFDFVINLFECENLESKLENLFSEEILLSTFFIPWQPSSKVFSETDRQCWLSIKSCLERAKTLLITRQYFEKKWLKNSANFLRYVRNPVSLINKIQLPLAIISSGPSLKSSLPLLKENRKSFFIICLSSALSVCIKNEIIPDLCMSSDGGYWAGEHLKKLYKNDIVLALTGEGFCPKALLSKNRVLPLSYPDGISFELIKASGISYMPAVRNGTISGTALFWALSNSSQDIYLFGLDMAEQKGFQHTQPNELEYNASIKDFRINTKEKRLTASQFSSASLAIYRKWFENYNFNTEERKIYRVINEDLKKNQLGKIIDINVKTFENKVKYFSGISNQVHTDFFEKQNISCDTICKRAFEHFEKISKEEVWKKQLFPLDYLLLSHNPNNQDAENKIKKSFEKLSDSIKGILNG